MSCNAETIIIEDELESESDSKAAYTFKNESISGLISIIILSYNDLSGIYDTLDSILQQDYARMEIIISDDASVGFKDEIPNYKQYINERGSSVIDRVLFRACSSNRGTVNNFNEAVSLSRGEYIKIIGTGDKLSDPYVISDFVDFLSNSDYLICFGKMIGVTLDGAVIKHLSSCEEDYEMLRNLTPKQTEMLLYRKNFLPAPAWCAKRKIFEDYGFVPQCVKYIDDYPYWCHLAKEGVKFGYLDRIVTDYKLSGISSSGNYNKAFMEDMFKIYDQFIFPNDTRYGVVQPFYNKLKKAGLNYYYKKAVWSDMGTPQKALTVLVYWPFHAVVGLHNMIMSFKNRR